MTWSAHHAVSEPAASAALLARREGADEAADRLYRSAAEAEERALAAIDRTKVRTLGVTAVSAATLWSKGRDYARAGALARVYLGIPGLPTFARVKLRALLCPL